MSKRPIQQDVRWPALVRRYANDLGAFAREVCGIDLDKQLALAFESVEKPGCRVSIASNLNPMERGVISPLAPIALWRLLCRPESTTMVAVPFGDMLRCCDQYGGLAKSIEGPAAWVTEYLSINTSTIKLRQQSSWSGIRFMAASERHPENMAGFCGEDMLWLMEDASSMPDVSFKVALGGLTDPNNCMVLHAGGGRISGFVQATRNERSKAAGGHWDVFDVRGSQPCKQPPKARLA